VKRAKIACGKSEKYGMLPYAFSKIASPRDGAGLVLRCAFGVEAQHEARGRKVFSKIATNPLKSLDSEQEKEGKGA
jgi:hypothetical protein